MSKAKWYVIANEEVAIVWKDGEVVVMPEPALAEAAQLRDVLPTGSSKGFRTFSPGHNKLCLKMDSNGPVLRHKELPEFLVLEVLRLLRDHCAAVQDEMKEMMESGLKPDQKPAQPSSG